MTRVVPLALCVACPMPTDETDSAVETGPGVSGWLVDLDGAPLAHRHVSACTRSVCLGGESDASGAFTFDTEPLGRAAIKTATTETEDAMWGVGVVAIRHRTSVPLDIGPLYVPRMPDGATVDASDGELRTLDCGDGVELTLRPADLIPPLGTDLTRVAAARIPDEYAVTHPDLAPADVVEAVYALHPFGAAVRSGDPAAEVGISVPTDAPDGAEVTFYSVDELDGTLSEPIAGVASAGRASASGLAHVTHVLVVTNGESR